MGKLWALCFTVILTCSACSLKEVDDGSSRLSINTEINEKNHIKVSGKTNLPENTRIRIEVEEPGRLVGTTELAVVNGSYESSWISDDGFSIRPGEYTIEVMSIDAEDQPEEVQDIIGPEGQNLKGDFVLQRPFGAGQFIGVHRKITLERQLSHVYKDIEKKGLHNNMQHEVIEEGVEVKVSQIDNIFGMVDIDVIIKNNTQEEIYVSALDFTVSQEDGVTINLSDDSILSFEGITLQPGQRTTGRLTFSSIIAEDYKFLNFNHYSGFQQIPIDVPEHKY